MPALFVAAALATYRPAADGDYGAYVRLTVGFSGASLIAYGLARLRAPVDSLLPLVVLALVLIPFWVLHAGRLLHPVRHGAPFMVATDGFESGHLDRRRWETASGPGAEIAVRSGAARISAPPGVTASMELLPGDAWWLRGAARWWLPAAFDSRHFAEQLDWQARVERHRTFFILVETHQLLVQLTPYGCHIMFHDASGAVSAFEVASPAALDGRDHHWRLAWSAGEVTLLLDGAPLWRRAGAEPLKRIRFGETRSDEHHGGVLELRSVSYRRWWTPPGAASTASRPLLAS